MDISELGLTDLDGEDLPRLIFVSVDDAYNLLWERNPKLHNIGELIQSFVDHGFQELPKYDATLGAVKAGNGRIEALYLMAHDAAYKDKRPRGISQMEDGGWIMPLLVGTDAKSVDLAIAYAIDSNNLTMSGGDFTGLDMSRMWGQEQYAELLNELSKTGVFPVSADQDFLDFLNMYTSAVPPTLDQLEEKYGSENEDGDFFSVIRIKVNPSVFEKWKEYKGDMTDSIAFSNLMNIVGDDEGTE